jgi:putative ABC transport system ATP-binding protein
VESDTPAFTFADVSVVKGGNRVLDGVSASIAPGGITVLFGPSGAGKTTLLRLCNRLEVPTGGTVSYHGRPLDEIDPLRLRRRVGMVFQRPTPFPGTVAENLAVAAPDAPREALAEALARAALPERLLDRPARELSGGELQRMCQARTLVTEPEALLLDEPTSALDEEPKRVFEDTARALAGQGVTIVWVTHEAAQLERVADHVLRMKAGRIEETG